VAPPNEYVYKYRYKVSTNKYTNLLRKHIYMRFHSKFKDLK